MMALRKRAQITGTVRVVRGGVGMFKLIITYSINNNTDHLRICHYLFFK
jgi:hypothetical protein